MPSRRELIALNDEEIAQYLASQQTLIIVSNGANGYPHPMPMWFYADAENCLYCTTFAKSQKVLNFKRDPKAALLVESGATYAELKSVLIYANAQIVEDVDEVVDCLVKINTKGQTLDSDALAQVREAVTSTAAKRVVLKFVPERIISWDHSKLGGGY